MNKNPNWGSWFRMLGILFLCLFIVSCAQEEGLVVPKIGVGPNLEVQSVSNSPLNGYWLLTQQDHILRGDTSDPENIDEDSVFFLMLRFLGGKVRISQYPDPNDAGATKGIHLCSEDPNYSFDGSQVRLFIQDSHNCDVTVPTFLQAVEATDDSLKIDQITLRTDKLFLIFSKIEEERYNEIVSDKFN